jgi:hypothetical protein
MTLNEFINKYLGKKIDYDGYYGGQCMDLYHQYCEEVLGSEHPGAASAYKLWRYTWKDFDKKNNTLTAVPERGDIVIWNTKAGGGHGHVAIFLVGDVNSFTSLDQNWPTLDKVTKTNHDYKNIYGWLHPKGDTMSSGDDITISKKTFENLVGKASKYDEFNRIGYGSAAEVTHELQGLRQSIDDKNEAIKAEKERAEGARKDYTDLLALVAATLNTQQEENQVKVALNKVSTQLDELDDLRRNYASLQLESGKEKEELNAEVARLAALLNNKGALKDYKLEELLKEIISRLGRILKRK